ncbi:MAG TPA: DEAD/DEAH box helicase [Longimicrobiales bacterium]|nr:DEAD/DEAH box helicase [Longimicrobiales bacterium]
MSEGLSELGLRAELVAAVAERGFDAPSALQRSAIPVLRRGGNAVLHASYGSGLTGAYGLALLDRLADAGDAAGPQVLIVTPTGARAASAADEIAALAGTLQLRIAALAPGWRDAESANVVTGSLQNVAGAIGRSALKLESVQAIVLESLSTLLEEGGAELDAIMTAVPRDAQRVITTATYDSGVERFVEQHARRAIRIPARAADRAATAAAEPAGEVHYLVVPEFGKDDALARLLVRSSGEDVLVTTRSARRAELVRGLLAARGYDTARIETLRVESAIEAPPRGARVIAYDAPMDAATLTHLHTGSGIVLVTPGELAHLRLLAAEANVTLRAEKARAGDRDVGSAFRAEIRRALQERDLDAQLLLLEPLFEEHSAAEVAAALSSLLRERRAGAPAVERRAPAGTVEEASGSAGAPSTFTRLFFSIGSRDGIRPGDLVGAITGEANVTGAQVGRIEMRDTFSVVEVAADAAERVIKALNGTTMRTRALRVDYDRRGSAPAGRERPAGGRERGRPQHAAGDRPRRPRPPRDRE